jgi:hypothetical protein
MQLSEIADNSAAVSISNAYYTDARIAGDAAAELGFQIGIDTADTVNDFGPDSERKLRRRAK